jgi:hypothetical protein
MGVAINWVGGGQPTVDRVVNGVRMKLSNGNGDGSADDNAHQSSETLPDPSAEFPEKENHNDDKDRQSEPLRTSIRRVC